MKKKHRRREVLPESLHVVEKPWLGYGAVQVEATGTVVLGSSYQSTRNVLKNSNMETLYPLEKIY